MRLYRSLNTSQSSAWFMAVRIRERFRQLETTFEGSVKVDETYMGGKRKNMPNSKRKQMTGLGTVGKNDCRRDQGPLDQSSFATGRIRHLKGNLAGVRHGQCGSWCNTAYR